MFDLMEFLLACCQHVRGVLRGVGVRLPPYL